MNIEFPVLIVNFKTFEESIGINAEKLAKICEIVSLATHKNIMACVTPADIFRISQKVNIPIFSQHMDPEPFGNYTGKILGENIKQAGAIGTLINHSEDRYPMDRIEAAVKRAKSLGIIALVCANDENMAEAVAKFSPDIIAVEPPELIGGDISISTAKPEVITKTIERVKKVADIPVICGAGVKTKEDVKKAIELGSKGILLASGITKAKDPEKILFEMVSVF